MARMQSAAPSRKVIVGTVAGAVTTIVVWVVDATAGVKIPGEVSAAITTVLTFIVSYMVPPSADDQVVA